MKTRRARRKLLDSSDEVGNSEVNAATSRKSSDSVYSSEESSNSLRNPISISSETKSSSQDDDFSQLKIKNTKRSKRARRPPDISSDSSGDDDSTSQLRPRKPSDSQYSSDHSRANENSEDASSSEESSDFSVSKKRNTKRRKKARQSSDESLDDSVNYRGKKSNSKRRASSDASSSDESSDFSETQARDAKRRRGKARQSLCVSSGERVSCRRRKKNAKRRASNDASSSEESSDFSEPETRSAKRRKSRQSSRVSSYCRNCRRKKKTSRRSASSDASSSGESSDFCPSRGRNAKRRKKARQSSDESPDDSIDRRRKKHNSKRKASSDASCDSEESSDFSETGARSTKRRRKAKHSPEYDRTSEAESDRSQVKKSNGTPKKCRNSNSKYKNLRVGSDSSQEDDEKAGQEMPIESPRKIGNRHVLKHKYRQLIPLVAFNKAKKVHDVIFGKSFEDLVLPEFSELLWRAVTTSSIDPEVASLLVRGGVDVNLSESGAYSGTTVLHVVAEKASRVKYERLALLLMSHGADVNRCNDEGNSVLWSAVKGGSLIVVEELMRRRVDVGERYDKVLRVAAESRCNAEKILPLLVEYNAADLETKDDRAVHALRCIVKADDGDLTAMKVLLDFILPLNDIDDDGNTLLHRAIIDNKFEMVKLLLEYGADPRRKRRDGTLPLWWAVRKPSSAIAGLLIKHGAKVNDCNDNFQYPIHGACNSQSSENIRLLLHFGAEVNVTDDFYEWTPFSTINSQNLSDATKLMIQHFAFLTSINAKFDRRDMMRVREFSDMRKYYAQCCCELERMKRMKIYEDISVHCILKYDVKKISYLIKNSELIDEYHKNQKQIKAIAPVYSSVIQKRMKIAWNRREMLISIENAIREGSKNVLPGEVCEKIAYLACFELLIDFDLKIIPFL